MYGPGDTTLLPKLLAARRGGHLVVPGDGTNRVSVTHVGNLAHAVLLGLASTDASGPFNIADEVVPTMDALLRRMLQQCGVADDVIYVPRAIAWRVAQVAEWANGRGGGEREPLLTRYLVSNMADTCVLDLTRARNVLGYRSVHIFTDADGPGSRTAPSPG